jgi:hypothetical protein
MKPRQKKQAQFSRAYLPAALARRLFARGALARRAAPRPIPMSDLVGRVPDGKLAAAQVRETESVAERKPEGDRKPPRVVATRLPGVEGNAALLAVPAALSDANRTPATA